MGPLSLDRAQTPIAILNLPRPNPCQSRASEQDMFAQIMSCSLAGIGQGVVRHRFQGALELALHLYTSAKEVSDSFGGCTQMSPVIGRVDGEANVQRQYITHSSLTVYLNIGSYIRYLYHSTCSD